MADNKTSVSKVWLDTVETLGELKISLRDAIEVRDSIAIGYTIKAMFQVVNNAESYGVWDSATAIKEIGDKIIESFVEGLSRPARGKKDRDMGIIQHSSRQDTKDGRGLEKMMLKGRTLEGGANSMVFFELCDVGPYYKDDDVIYVNGIPLRYSTISAATERHRNRENTEKER